MLNIFQFRENVESDWSMQINYFELPNYIYRLI